MTKQVYKTARGKNIDMGALILQNENVRAVGNMKVNARGDLLDDKGQVIRWITHVFEVPKFVPEKVQNPKKGNLGKNQNSLFENVEKGECRKGTTTNNRSKQTIDLNNNKQPTTATNPKPKLQSPSQEPDPNVVASLMEKLEQWAIAETLLRTWLRKYSAEYILCKIEYTKSYATKNPAGLLRRAIENDYKLPLSKQPALEPKVPAEPVYPTHEENLAWYAGLSNEEKLALQKEAVHKQYTFEGMLKGHNVSVLDDNFVQHGLFKMFMELIGRAK